MNTTISVSNESPRSGHLGAAWEVALVVVFCTQSCLLVSLLQTHPLILNSVVFGVVIGVTVCQVRKRKARREQRRARRAARATAAESPVTLADDKTSTTSTSKPTPSSERKRGFFDPSSSEEDGLTTEDEESSIGSKKQFRKAERRTSSSRRSGSRRHPQTGDRASHSGSGRSSKRGRTMDRERTSDRRQEELDEKVVDEIVTIEEEEGYVSEDEGKGNRARKKKQKPTPSVPSEKSRPTSPTDRLSESKNHDPSLDLEAGPGRIPKPPPCDRDLEAWRAYSLSDKRIDAPRSLSLDVDMRLVSPEEHTSDASSPPFCQVSMTPLLPEAYDLDIPFPLPTSWKCSFVDAEQSTPDFIRNRWGFTTLAIQVRDSSIPSQRRRAELWIS
ncbi:hypothetical protein BKA70DRAFT_1435153 [Coprinopsis sp. MPI-PUGE-AT-0042]|nr:hypothetical protein BKA70DRAFT_1435153 [Coprinopsis sp. MPI-PUGE-AT-0042]